MAERCILAAAARNGPPGGGSVMAATAERVLERVGRSAAASRHADAVVRAGRADDAEALYTLACADGSGLTNLPADRAALRARLEAGEAAASSAEARARGAAIILVVESGGAIVGTSCVFARIGAEWPFHSYRLTRQAARSPAVGRSADHVLLHLANDFDGETEVGGLFIDPRARGGALGALAARARYMFIAAHRAWFGQRVIAELRGWQDAEGKSPVWEAIGRHFYGMEFHEADRTGALLGNQFIADLGPRYPLYASLLPAPARAALGRPHDDGRPAYDMLIAEGFRAGDYVDIFDGGPTLVADIDSVRTVREAHAMAVRAIGDPGGRALVAAGEGMAFRAAWGQAADGVISAETAARLGVGPGDRVFVSAV